MIIFHCIYLGCTISQNGGKIVTFEWLSCLKNKSPKKILKEDTTKYGRNGLARQHLEKEMVMNVYPHFISNYIEVP